VTAIEEIIKLVVGKAKFGEAEFPQSHIFERAVSVMPRDKPVWATERKENTFFRMATH